MITSASDKRINRSYAAGFTVIETLIVAVIIVSVSAYVVAWSNVGRRQTILQLETHKVAELILRAKSLAITTFNRPLSTCGYGVEVDYQTQTYSLFSYTPSPSQPTCTSIPVINAPNRSYISGESLKINSGVRLVGTNSDSLTFVLFVPPDPRVLISTNSGGSVGAGPAKVYLETIDDPPDRAYRGIFISTIGQVDF